jgi:transcription termination/antitermination protein NusG
MPRKINSNTTNDENKDSELQVDLKPRWYIIQTYVGFEDAVKKSLELKIQTLSLQDKILEIFIPTKTVTKLNRKGEKEEKEEKIYPGYIYLRMVLNKEIGYLIQNTNYISRITGTGNVAVPLDEGYVEKLKQNLLESPKNELSSKSQDFRLGDLVLVIDGPFKDMQGKITGINPKDSKLDIVLTMFDRDTVVTLDSWEVKKAL